jgi:hypothetical protein
MIDISRETVITGIAFVGAVVLLLRIPLFLM